MDGPSRYWHFVLLLLLPGLAGCAGGKTTSRSPIQLSEVNQSLKGTQATITWRDGETLKDLSYVRVTPDSIRYSRHTEPGSDPILFDLWERESENQMEEKACSRPINMVRRITTEEPSGFWTGVLIGASPGALFLGKGLLDAEDCAGTCFGAALAVQLGKGLVIGGGLLGGIIGDITGGEKHVVYVGPVDRYLTNE